MNPTFSLIKGSIDSNSGMGLVPVEDYYKKAKSSSLASNSFILKLIAFFTTVFFPITKCPPFLKISLLIY